MRTTLATLTAIGLLVGALAMAPAVSAQTFHQTYEVGPTYGAFRCYATVDVEQDVNPNEDCDPTGLTQDDSIDTGGAIFLPDEVAPGATSLQASIVDDVFGSDTTAGYLCTDQNDNNVCGETDQGEVRELFCGASPVVPIPTPDKWDAAVVFASYPGWMVTQGCDGFGTTGGVLDPAGGIYATFA